MMMEREAEMLVTRWDDGLAVRIPEDVVRTLGLKEGDEIDLQRIDDAGKLAVRKLTAAEAAETIRRLARPLPKDYKFDREDANAR